MRAGAGIIVGTAPVRVARALRSIGLVRVPSGFGRYPGIYNWLLLAATLDLAVTLVVLAFGGREANAIADVALRAFGPYGLALVKAMSLIVVVGICEWLARRRAEVGARLARVAVAVTFVPVLVGSAQLAAISWLERDDRVWDVLITRTASEEQRPEMRVRTLLRAARGERGGPAEARPVLGMSGAPVPIPE